jgi:FtsH-binding integral membrane protein
MAKDDRPLATSPVSEDARAVDEGAQAPAVSEQEADRTRAQFAAMLRTALLPTLVTGAGAVVVAALLGGSKAAWSAALGAAVVVVVFSLSLLVMRQTAHLQPIAVMSVVLATYTAKILALGIVMVVLRDASWLSGQALALSIIACTVVWIAFEMRAFTKLRILVAPGAEVPVADGAASGTDGEGQR